MRMNLPRSLAALALAVGLGSVPVFETAASTRSNVQVAGYVPARAGVSMTRTVSLLPVGSKHGRLFLTELSVAANNKQFTVKLTSNNAPSTGEPALVEQVGGRSIPYRLTFGGSEVSFVEGEAQLRMDRDDEDGASRRLELELTGEQPSAAGMFQERLLVVITAR